MTAAGPRAGAVQRLLVAANELAARRGSATVGAEHFCLALIGTEKVAALLQSLVGDGGRIASELHGLVPATHNAGGFRVPRPGSRIAISRECQQAIEHAYAIAAEMELEVAEPHLLAGLLEAAPTLPPCLFLVRSGVTHAVILRELTRWRAGSSPQPAEQRQGNLAKFAVDLTALAGEGLLDPMIGRRAELEHCLQVLNRRLKKNPVLLGEPGVGKTAIVEGIAQLMALADAPTPLRGRRLMSLDLGRLIAGTRYRGEFEDRLKSVLDEVIESAGSVILFVDELHKLIGAGAAIGAIDASSMMKPLLARGALQVIGATTAREFRRYLAIDPALERRFQPIVVEEPSLEETVAILEGLRSRYEAHHGLRICTPALAAAARLSQRHVPDRYLPDKAVDLLDEACAAVRTRDTAPRSAGAVEELHVAAVVERWTGVPVERLLENDSHRHAELAARLGSRIQGQPKALETVLGAIRLGFSGLGGGSRPLASLLLRGPSGVGKTEVAVIVADTLFDGDASLLRLDMSAYRDPSSAPRLLGVRGSDSDLDGDLVGPVRRRPYSVVLLENIDLASAEVARLVVSLLATGKLPDGQQRSLSFAQAIVLLTMTEAESGEADAARLPGDLMRALEDSVDAVARFRPLSGPGAEAIVTTELDRLRTDLEGHGIRLLVTSSAVRHLARRLLESGEGAKPLARLVRRELLQPLAGLSLDHGETRLEVILEERDSRLELSRTSAPEFEPLIGGS